jgi:hypothetical protein
MSFIGRKLAGVAERFPRGNILVSPKRLLHALKRLHKGTMLLGGFFNATRVSQFHASGD